jgi:hypothetical protein
MQKIELTPLPAPKGVEETLFMPWGIVDGLVFHMRNMDNTYTRYAYIHKPHTEFGITASIRKI